MAICSLLHRTITQFGPEPLSTSPLEGASMVPDEKRSGVKDAATFDDSQHHFQLPRGATEHL